LDFVIYFHYSIGLFYKPTNSRIQHFLSLTTVLPKSEVDQ